MARLTVLAVQVRNTLDIKLAAQRGLERATDATLASNKSPSLTTDKFGGSTLCDRGRGGEREEGNEDDGVLHFDGLIGL